MPHVLVAGRIHEAGLDLLGRTEGFTVEVVDEVSTESYAPRVGGADAVLIRTQPMPANVIAKAGRLKIVSRHGVGYDAVDVEALNRRGIPLAVVGDVNTRSVAEHTLTLMLMLALAKRTLAYDAAVRDGDWGFRNSLEAIELNGRTLLVIGFGRIGRAVGALATAFGMRVLAYDPLLSASAIEAAGAEAAKRLDDALGEADVVTIHMPGNGRTLLGAAELARLKPTALIINTARGGIVDEAALAAALAQGRLGGAALDVFACEPPAAGQPLSRSTRTVLTPHAAALTQEGAARMSFDAARNIIEFFAGRIDPKLVVNAEAIALATSVAASAG
jgi:D-3-phosphoglycerate dehydrogenase